LVQRVGCLAVLVSVGSEMLNLRPSQRSECGMQVAPTRKLIAL
jgi:hypothetical protein